MHFSGRIWIGSVTVKWSLGHKNQAEERPSINAPGQFASISSFIVFSLIFLKFWVDIPVHTHGLLLAVQLGITPGSV